MAVRERQSDGTIQRVSYHGRPARGPGAVEAHQGTMVERNESWMNVYCSAPTRRSLYSTVPPPSQCMVSLTISH